MYVCICRAVSESKIRAAIRNGAQSVEEVERVCGAGGDCGSCREDVSEMIAAEHAAQGSDAASRCASCPHATRDTHAPRAA